jgi:uncharacterized protein (AIM24 family)
MGRGQPAAFFGSAVRRRRKGFFLRDRSVLDLVETTDTAKCADAKRPFLTHIPCAAPISAASAKVLVAPAAARTGAEVVKMIPMSVKGSLCVTVFGEDWVVLATASRTARLQVADGDTLSVRPESIVAWTGNRPTGFCPKLGLWDVLLPCGPRDLLLHFHGPSVVWVEGSNAPNLQTSKLPNFYRRSYGA